MFTATLTNASQGVTTIHTDKGDITIADGALSGTLVIASGQGEDPYLDATSKTATITGTEGGNFENLVVGTGTATAHVNDTIDTTTVNLSASTQAEDPNATYVFTATLSNASHGTTTIVTDQGTIAIADGATSGNLTLAAGNIQDDASLTATITSATGGNFEHLVVGTGTATAHITGVNDAPTASAPTNHYSAIEQLALSLKGTGLSVNDVDARTGTLTATLSVGEGTLTATAGDSGVTVGGSGSLSLTISGTLAQLNAFLGASGTSTLSYVDNTDTPSASTTLSLSVNDNGNTGSGGPLTGNATSTIDITPINDAPVAKADTGSVTASNTLTVTAANGVIQGVGADTDVDNATNTLVVSGAVAGTGAVTQGQGVATMLNGTYGHLTLNANGSYTYIADNAGNIAGGSSAFDTFTYTAKDPGGLVSNTTTLTITVNGNNHAPVVNPVNAGTLTDTAANDTFGNLTGSISASDADGQTLTYGISGVTPSGGVATLVGTYGMLSVTTATGAYTFTPNNTAINTLAAGSNPDQTFTITASDGTAMGSNTLTVHLVGANDTPVVNATTKALTDTAVQDAGTVVSTGTAGTAGTGVLASDSDRDGDSLSVSAVNGVAGNVGNSVGGAYGNLTLNSNGSYSYTANSAYDALKASDPLKTDTFAYTVSDGHGGTVTQNLVFNIQGVNDTPVVNATTKPLTDTAAKDAGTVVSSGTAGTAGTGVLAGDSDRDGDTLTLTAVNGSAGNLGVNVAGTYGTLVLNSNGSYTYTANAAYDALKPTDGLKTDTFSYTASDSNGGTITQNLVFNITGVNDAPVVNAVNAGTLTDTAASDTFSNLTGNIVAADSEGQTLTYGISGGTVSAGTSTLVGTYGALTVNTSTGAYTFTPNNAAINGLPAGSNPDQTFTITASDGSLTGNNTLAVHLVGANDPPALSGATWTWGTSPHQKELTIAGSISDPDGSAGSETVSIDWGDGTTTQVAANASGSFPAQTHTYKNASAQTVILTVTDSFGAFVSKSTITSTSGTGTFPAGVAGSPINLGLDHPADATLATIFIAALPAGWHIEGGEQQADGSWVVQTHDASTLTVTTSPDFVGAGVLDLSINWTDASGVGHTQFVADNVEAYAAGTPIFAWSGDDTLTGSAAADTFVFSQPIGADTIHAFDTADDVVDLIGYDQFSSFADIIAHVSDNASGDAVLDLGSGQSITFNGVHAADLVSDNFELDVQPSWSNSASITIGDGAMLPMSGALANSGTIELQDAGSGTLLQIIQHGLTLTGGGSLVLSDSLGNTITGTLATVTLTNVNNTISGAGQLGGGTLTLVNGGTILANGTHALVIDTGSNTIANSGMLEATGSGGLSVLSSLDNSGHLWANGGALSFASGVSGTGDATVSGAGSIEFDGASSMNVLFDASAAGTLTLTAPGLYSGTVSGFDGNDQIDFSHLMFDQSSTVGYVEDTDGLGGVLTVAGGGETAQLHLAGDYSAVDFALGTDGHGGILVTVTHHDPVLEQPGMLTL